MPEGNQNQRGVPMTVPAGISGSGHCLIDLVGGGWVVRKWGCCQHPPVCHYFWNPAVPPGGANGDFPLQAGQAYIIRPPPFVHLLTTISLEEQLTNKGLCLLAIDFGRID